MTLSEFTLRIIFIFLPGLIASIIIEELTVHAETKPYRLFLNSLMLGLFCYFLYYLISLVPFFNLKFHFLQNLSKLALDFKEIIIVTLISIPLGFLISLAINQKYLHKIAKKLHVSKKHGDIDVWSYLMNSKIPLWVVIRDMGNDLMYEGWVEAFSDSTEKDELFLVNVKVFRNSTAEELYEIPGLYLPKKREHLTIEFPSMTFERFKERQEPENKEVKNE
jgi:hypothetical protein